MKINLIIITKKLGVTQSSILYFLNNLAHCAQTIQLPIGIQIHISCQIENMMMMKQHAPIILNIT